MSDQDPAYDNEHADNIQESPLSIIPCESNIITVSHTDLYKKETVYFHIIYLKDSFCIFIGTKPVNISNLHIAMLSRLNNQPIVTTLFGANVDDFSNGLALRLAKRTKCVVYVSVQVSIIADEVGLWIEKKVYDLIKERFPKINN